MKFGSFDGGGVGDHSGIGLVEISKLLVKKDDLCYEAMLLYSLLDHVATTEARRVICFPRLP